MQRWTSELLEPRDAHVTLGLGLIGIGKPWGYRDPEVPDERAARALLERAFSLGIRYLDTAPSYGVSEARLSDFLRSLQPSERASLTIATKFGEHWDPVTGSPFVDHTFAALERSLDESLRRLGTIDFLQLHKTTPEALRGADVRRAFDYARSLGIRNLGASVSDLVSAQLVLDDPSLSVVQLPYNIASVQFGKVMRAAADAGVWVVINRPFGMGSLLYGERALPAPEAFRFVLREPFRGVVLTGTKSVAHIEENWAAFHRASAVR